MSLNFQKYNQSGKRITMLTAYDASMARLLEKSSIDILLVGDSLGNVFQGASSTQVVTVEQIEYHLKAVRAGAPNSCIIADMPYMSYETPEIAVNNALRLKKSGANAVKLEGYLPGVVKAIVQAGVDVCGHIGLLPQTAEVFKVQGKEESDQNRIRKEALAIQEEGAKMIVIECTSSALATNITQDLSIPTIGIGAGPHCDGQVLVINDLLGFREDKGAKFVRRYADLHQIILQAAKNYISDVQSGSYPSESESYR